MPEHKGHPPTTNEKAPKPEPQHKEPSDGGYFNPAAASILLSVFKPGSPPAAPGNGKPDAGPDRPAEPPTTASVKFMITTRDEQELRALGYVQEQIDRLKPAQVAAILKGRIPPGELQ